LPKSLDLRVRSLPLDEDLCCSKMPKSIFMLPVIWGLWSLGWLIVLESIHKHELVKI
jgi:hypothetical protein